MNLPFVWQTHLNADAKEQARYNNFVNPQLAELFARPPRLMLDIGCAAGLFGSLVKEKYPGTKVVGVELNRAAAEIARTRLDYVFNGNIEEIDLSQAGVVPGTVDTVVVADVLEHMYDPWKVMVRLKRELTRDAQVIASIPNIRNLGLVLGLLDGGHWRYAELGLLDITHIRFFTLEGIHEFFTQTGYRVGQVAHFLDPNLVSLRQQNMDKSQISLRAGRVALENLTPPELTELCTWQFFVRACPTS